VTNLWRNSGQHLKQLDDRQVLQVLFAGPARSAFKEVSPESLNEAETSLSVERV
jgi:hypothetical protein